MMNLVADLLFASFMALSLVAVSHAQIGNPAGLAPGTRESAPGTPSSGEMNQVDRLFVQQLAIASRAEIALGRAATGKAQDPAIGKFARRMTDDHTRAGNNLAELAKTRNVELPHATDADQQMMQEKLRKLSGSEFDAAYISGQIQSHQKAATLLEWEIDSGENPQFKRFASETLPMVFRHLEMAQNLQLQLTGTASQTAASSARPH